MKIYKNKVIPPRIHKYESARLCDICQDKLVGTEHDHKWGLVQFETIESLRNYGSKTQVNYDVCKQCFDEKIIPFMTSIGAKSYTEESDW